MRRNLSILLAIMLMVMVSGCGSKEVANAVSQANVDTAESQSEEVAEEKVEPLDLTGLWVQENAGASYMAATIKEDGIMGVFFILENDKEPWTYWIGTYDAPTEATDKYKWTSKNTYGGNGLMASSAETKDYEYEDGKIKYSVTIQGETADVSLVRGEWDTSNIPQSAFASVKVDATTDIKNLEIKDSGWFLKNDEWLYYYIDIYNPNEDIAIELPSYRITARDASNVLLGTEDQTLSIIYPGQHFIYGGQAFGVDEAPTTVDFEILDPEDYNIKKADALDEYKELSVVNSGLRSEKIVGEINNPNSKDYDMVAVVVICRDADNNVVDIESSFVDNVKAGITTPFEISMYSNAKFESMEVYANQW